MKLIPIYVMIVLMIAVPILSQTPPPSSYAPQLITYQSANTGGCAIYQFNQNVSNGAFSTCDASTYTWLPFGGASSVYYCGTTTTCANAQKTRSIVRFGAVALNGASPSLATITGLSPAYTSTDSYACLPEDAASNQATEITKVSGSSFTVNGPNASTDVTNYICVGY